MVRFIIGSMIIILSLIFTDEAQAQVRRSKTHHKTQVQVKKNKAYHKKSTQRHTAAKKKKQHVYYGTASYYSGRFRGRKTASGATYRQTTLTAACNRLPLGTMVRVTNLKNKKSIVVKVNDRMGSRSRRLIDLTKSGAKRLGFVNDGIARVKVEPIGRSRR